MIHNQSYLHTSHHYVHPRHAAAQVHRVSRWALDISVLAIIAAVFLTRLAQ